MISQIAHVHLLSNHSFTGAVNASEVRMPPDLHCNENRLQTTTLNCYRAWLSLESVRLLSRGLRVQIPTCLIYFCGKNVSHTRVFYSKTGTSLAKSIESVHVL
jgi:hypothetical protein